CRNSISAEIEMYRLSVQRACVAAIILLTGMASAQGQQSDATMFGYWESDGYWYPLTSVELLDQVARVKFHDGAKKELPRGQVCKLTLMPGTRVQGDWLGKGVYFPGKVASADEDRVQIEYDDGDIEDTTSMKLRLIPDGFENLEVGQPVFAVWDPNGFWYSGMLQKIDGKKYFVKFD